MNLSTLCPRWEFPEKLPITFLYGGKKICGIPAGWSVSIARKDTVTSVEATSPEGLRLQLQRKTYPGFTAVEYAGTVTNCAQTTSPLVENLRFTAQLSGTDAVVYHGNGDTHLEDGYEWQTDPLPLELSPSDDGTSCNGAFPYMRLRFADHGVNIAVGWSGMWSASFAQEADSVFLQVGQKRCHMVIHPGETMAIPSLTMVFYEGDEDAARNTWRHWYFAHILPKQNGALMAPKCCMHLFMAQGKPEFTGATEENQTAAIDAYLKAGIRPDVWWIDAGWYPCDYNWRFTGNWYANPENFPQGLKPISDRCHKAGMEFLLWFEPERVHRDSEFDRAHPQWLLRYQKDGKEHQNRLVNLADPDCCNYVIEMLDKLIKENGVDIYRQDFNLLQSDINFGPGAAWLAAETPDRIGAVENLHIQGYYRMWDSLLARNPGLIIDSCASGGRRNDLETMRRSITLHYTDVGYGHHPQKLNQHRQMFEWIPYFRAHNHNWCAPDGSYDKTYRKPDKYSYYAAMAPALTDVTEYNADEPAMALARQMQQIWRKAAKLMIGTDYYPLTQCRKSSNDFYAAQFYDPNSGKGLVHMVNGTTAVESEFTVKLRGLEHDAVYTFSSCEENRTWQVSGKALMDGISIILEKHCADIWFFEKA